MSSDSRTRADVGGGRAAQKRRTRQALLDAANSFLDSGQRPTVDDAAERAEVSRATAYRYFASSDELLSEAVMGRALAAPSLLFEDASGDLVDRALRAEAAVNELLLADEVAAHVVSRLMSDAWLSDDSGPRGERPARRLPLIEAALEPFADRLGPERTRRLCDALALAIGVEAVIVLRDVCGLSMSDTRATARWAVESLVRTALAEAGEGLGRAGELP